MVNLTQVRPEEMRSGDGVCSKTRGRGLVTIYTTSRKSLDWHTRQADPITQLPAEVVNDVLQKLNTLLR